MDVANTTHLLFLVLLRIAPASWGLFDCRARRGGSSAAGRGGASGRQVARGAGSTATMMRLYTEDAPGLKVDPVVVLVLSLVFIASVFLLHIYGKLTSSLS
ncbi:hypothetical protein GGH99_003695 [Coemansia sp. RSA 1285]|nr:hypothetical protein GGH99_003695 [Coemansia sp. RSA 1285]